MDVFPPIQLTIRISPASTLRRKALTMIGSSPNTDTSATSTQINGPILSSLYRNKHSLVSRIHLFDAESVADFHRNVRVRFLEPRAELHNLSVVLHRDEPL